LFTLKRSISHLDKTEVETEVTDYDGMRRVIIALGYPTVVRVVKMRVKTRLSGTEICLDDVENLGSFIEVERMIPLRPGFGGQVPDDRDGDVVTAELHDFLESLGVPKEDNTVTMGYDVLLYERGLVEQVSAV
jgi:adenylate cyclase class 2